MKWWKFHESTFPILSKMTRDLLTPPMSTVASKFAFSIVGNTIGDKGTRLAPKMLETLTCLKNEENERMGLQILEDECKVELENLDINKNKNV